MKTSKIFILFFTFIISHFLSCGLQAQSEWVKLEYHFNSGSLPPPYHYSYTITISNDGKEELVYISEYQEKDKTNIFITILAKLFLPEKH